MQIKFNRYFFLACLVIFVIEVVIAIFASDNPIRGSLGDILVVVLIYCFIKSFFANEIKLLWLYIFVFAVLVEIGQYFHLVDLLGLSENRFAAIILGSTFDPWDIVCYFVGCICIWFFEVAVRSQRPQLKSSTPPKNDP